MALNPLTLAYLNQADQATFARLLEGTYEHSPWIAERAWAQRPFKTLAQLKHALAQAVSQASEAEQLGELVSRFQHGDTATVEARARAA